MVTSKPSAGGTHAHRSPVNPERAVTPDTARITAEAEEARRGLSRATGDRKRSWAMLLRQQESLATVCRRAIEGRELTRRVLILDDHDPDRRRIAEAVERALGVQCIHAVTATEGRVAWRKYRPAVIVADLYLGAETETGADLLASLPRGPRAVIYSAVATESDVTEVAQRLDAECVEKGHVEELIAKVRRLLDEAAPVK